MNILIFVLGVISAIVMILVIAVVVIMLKIKDAKQIEKDLMHKINEEAHRLDDNISEVQRSIGQTYDDLDHKVKDNIIDLARAIDQVKDSISLLIEKKDNENLEKSKSYTDCRIDKVINK